MPSPSGSGYAAPRTGALPAVKPRKRKGRRAALTEAQALAALADPAALEALAGDLRAGYGRPRNEPPLPCLAPPGSAAKILALQDRAAAGQALWHRLDGRRDLREEEVEYRGELDRLAELAQARRGVWVPIDEDAYRAGGGL